MALSRRLASSDMADPATVITPGVATSNGRGGESPGAPVTLATVCRVAEAGGDEADAAIVAVRGRYRISLPVATVVAEGASITALGRRFRVVWAPPAGAHDASRTVGAKESQ